MTSNKQRISNGLWFNTEAEEAARFYTSIFPDSNIEHITRYGKEGHEIHGQPEGQVMVVIFNLSGSVFMAVNGGPLFTFNPSISYFVMCESREETDATWNALAEGGKVLMPLQQYDWSERYGWVEDRYGLSWQISLGKLSDVGQKITPSFLFVKDQFGRAEEAVNFYTSVFKDSRIDGVMKHEQGEDKGTVMHAQFRLNGQTFMAMDGPGEHHYEFNEAVSIIVDCDTQEEIDYYWKKLSEGGQESACGWLKDKFGVSWQVEPTRLGEMLLDPDKRKTENVTKAFLRMKKFDIAELEKAYAM